MSTIYLNYEDLRFLSGKLARTTKSKTDISSPNSLLVQVAGEHFPNKSTK